MQDKATDSLDTRMGVFANPYEDDDEGSAEDLSGIGIRVNRSSKVTPLYRPAGS